MKVYVKTYTDHNRTWDKFGDKIQYTSSFYHGPFESMQDAVEFICDGCHDGAEILEFEA